MSEDAIPEGAVTRIELAGLAGLFDRFEFAFDPLSTDAQEAESAFETRLKQLFDERVAPQYASVDFATFRWRVRSLCRVYLKKNTP